MKPLLLLDVDGVLCPWGDPPPEGYRQYWCGEDWDWVSDYNGEQIMSLTPLFEIVWCTARDLTVLDCIGPAHNLPPFKVIEFGTLKTGAGRHNIIVPAHFNGQSWKLPWVCRFAQENEGRALVWIDDDLHEDAYEWAEDRSEGGFDNTRALTYLIQPDPNIGITAEHFTELRQFAGSLTE